MPSGCADLIKRKTPGPFVHYLASLKEYWYESHGLDLKWSLRAHVLKVCHCWEVAGTFGGCLIDRGCALSCFFLPSAHAALMRYGVTTGPKPQDWVFVDWNLLNHEPKWTLSPDKLIYPGICYSDGKLTETIQLSDKVSIETRAVSPTSSSCQLF
jgi:hypothetical protein